MKHLHKIFNSEDLPWIKLIWETYFEGKSLPNKYVGSCWWKSISKLIPGFKAVTKCTIGKANTIILWQDRWSDDLLKDKFPKLYSFALLTDISIK